jgi:hypothetical protein
MSTNPRNRSTPATPPVPTEELEAMLTRLRLPAIRDRLDALLEEAARRELNLSEALAWLCAAEVARKDQLRHGDGAAAGAVPVCAHAGGV